MSSFTTYSVPPRSPTFGFFPTAPSAPHAFSSLHGDPRDTHTMYAALGSMGFQSSGSPSHSGGSSSQNTLKKFYRK
ncbi:hypothetical protein PAXRUDRAFT_834609 [Paxillus rubicundulus Ve08.2h10]|uniref:Uncharacterized protein n=1 Tax=Paxillus rubicundulus Ve08.2h10 TaxID=930991 RepID=A0A0D0DJK3_9AGAM|nr:hypothetical protein PAXRUDRAFT_834609 [Paxillus rubicundulus Ve08.2h10]